MGLKTYTFPSRVDVAHPNPPATPRIWDGPPAPRVPSFATPPAVSFRLNDIQIGV